MNLITLYPTTTITKTLTVDEFAELISEWFSRRAAKMIFEFYQECYEDFKYEDFNPNDWDEFDSVAQAAIYYDIVKYHRDDDELLEELKENTTILHEEWEDLDGSHNLYVVARF